MSGGRKLSGVVPPDRALQPALDQPLDEAGPERLRFRGTDPEPEDLASAVGRDDNSDYGRHRDNAAALADFQISRVKPQIRPLALDRALQKGRDPLIDVLAQLGDLAL